MSTARKTKEITFNLKDRGRKHTGQERSNVDYKSWINLINSPATQEMISTGSMLGYYGHQIRIAWGLNPPETVLVGDKLITISPAIRTIALSCDDDCNVTHREEFLETPEGEFALNQYRAKVGGFSAAHDHDTFNGIIIPTEVCGMDYVLQPNYATNIGDGLLLDSVQNGVVKAALEETIAAMYDGIHSMNYGMHLKDENLMRAIQAENALLEERAKKQRYATLQAEKEELFLDSVLCPTMDLEEYFQQGCAFDKAQVVTSIEPSEKEKIQPRPKGGMFGFF